MAYSLRWTQTQPHASHRTPARPVQPPVPSRSWSARTAASATGSGRANAARHTAAPAARPLPWLVNATDGTFEAEAKSSVAVVVDLWAPWCGPCRFVGPVLEDLSREFAGRLKVVKVNVDENPVLSRRFDATSIPTLVVMKDGRVVDRVVGALPKSDLTVRLTPYLLRA